MRRMNKNEIDDAADHRYRASIAGHGLNNGTKIAYQVWKLFKAEKLRRKGIKK